MTELLLLRAEDAEDLKILSACVQDMAVKAMDVAWEPKRGRLVLDEDVSPAGASLRRRIETAEAEAIEDVVDAPGLMKRLLNRS